MNNVVDKELVEKLNDFSKIVHQIKELTEKEKTVEETVINGVMFEDNKELIEMFNNEVETVRKELKESIKDLKTIREFKRDEIMEVISEEYEAPFKAKLPNIGSISATWEDVPYLNKEIINKEEVVKMLIETGNLDCIDIDEQKYILASELSEKEFPGIEKKQESKITIRG